jgi:hypothetical protein
MGACFNQTIADIINERRNMDKRRTQSETDSINSYRTTALFLYATVAPEPSGHRSTKWLQKKSEVDNTRSRMEKSARKIKPTMQHFGNG